MSGATRELNQVRTLVEESRLVTLTGAGGSGKTRLALQVAAELLDGSGDGVWFVDLAPLADPDLVAESMATAIGVREEPGRPVAEPLIDALREPPPRRAGQLRASHRYLRQAHRCHLARLPWGKRARHQQGAAGIDGEAASGPLTLASSAGTTTLDQSEALGFEEVQLFVDRARSATVTGKSRHVGT